MPALVSDEMMRDTPDEETEDRIAYLLRAGQEKAEVGGNSMVPV